MSKSLKPSLHFRLFDQTFVYISHIYFTQSFSSTVIIIILIIFAKSEGRRPLGRPRRRWVVNIKRDIREIGFDGIDWIDLDQNRDRWRTLVNTIMNLWFHKILGSS
jgi:hypothetical protein